VREHHARGPVRVAVVEVDDVAVGEVVRRAEHLVPLAVVLGDGRVPAALALARGPQLAVRGEQRADRVDVALVDRVAVPDRQPPDRL
jgi:hypothetical protein